MSNINDRIAMCIEKIGLTKTAFAEKLNVSQQYISKLTKNGTPSDRTIIDICREFGISEIWLRTGEGEMFEKLSRDDEIADFIGDVMRGEKGDFRRRLIAVLSRLPPEGWDLLERMALDLAAEAQTDQEDEEA